MNALRLLAISAVAILILASVADVAPTAVTRTTVGTPFASPIVPAIDNLTLLRAHLTQREAAANEVFWASLANVSLADIGIALDRAHAGGKLLNWTPEGIHVLAVESQAQWSLLGCSLNCYIGLALTGCAVSGLVAGLLSDGLGAGIGCTLGATAAVLIGYFGFGTASAANNAAELNFIRAETIQFENDLIYAQGMINQTFSALNSTYHAWAAMADSAALQQLPNVTFDPLWDLNESGVSLQLATILAGIRQATDAAWHDLDVSIISGWGPQAQFASNCFYYIAIVSATLGCDPSGGFGSGTGPNDFWAHANAAIEGSASNGTGVTVQAGGFFYALCTQNTYINQVGTNTTGEAHRQINAVATVPTLLSQTANYEATYRFHILLAGSCDLLGAGFTMAPAQGATSPTTQIALVVCGFHATTANCNPTNTSASGWGKFNFPFQFQVKILPGGGSITQAFTATGTFAAFKNELNSLMNSAVTEGRTYWTFLHLLGYTNANQIPSNCIIPTPNQVLPPQYSTNLGTLTLNQTLSLYEAWLNGLAVFFGSNQTASTFCAGHSVFQVGFVGWNLNVITTGFVFTLPKANQNFGTKTTWTVTNATQTTNQVGNYTRKGLRTDPAPIVIWATVVTLNVKVGTVQEIPQNDPIDVFSPNNGTLYLLTGNGTNVNGQGWSNTTASSSTGAAIFISTCSVLNPATGTYQTANNGVCVLQLSSIKNVTFPTTVQPPPVILSGSACGQTFPLWAQLVQFWDGIVGPFLGPLGLDCVVAEVLSIISLIVIVVFIFYVGAAIFRAARPGQRVRISG